MVLSRPKRLSTLHHRCVRSRSLGAGSSSVRLFACAVQSLLRRYLRERSVLGDRIQLLNPKLQKRILTRLGVGNATAVAGQGKIGLFPNCCSFFTIRVCVPESCVGSVSINQVINAMSGLLMHDKGKMMRELPASQKMAVL